MADGTISKIQLPDNTIYDVVDNTSGYMTGMTILSYGSSTWQNFIDAYSSNKVVYCRASSNANPASGSQTRLAFMAYVNNATTPTEVEFQYYRSVSTHTASQQGDQVYVYKLNKTNGWSVTIREASVKVVAGTGLGGTYSNGTMTLTGPTKVSDLTNDSGFITLNDIPTTHSIPSGGTTGQILAKNSATDYDVSWADASGGGAYIVTFTYDDVNDEYSCDKTAQEIYEANEDGITIIGLVREFDEATVEDPSATYYSTYQFRGCDKIGDGLSAEYCAEFESMYFMSQWYGGDIYTDKFTVNGDDVSYTHSSSTIVPTSRKINNKRLSSDITLTASDVGAQEPLVSGTNIKTINNTSLLGSGNIDIQSGSSVFVAEYGVTTYADVSYAYNHGATILCERYIDGVTYLLPLFGENEEGYSFYFGSGNTGGFISASVSRTAGWQGSTISFATKDTATTSKNGLMSSSDKTKLDGIASGAEVNVNADWNAVSGDAQILNKPTIPTVNNATLTIQKNGSTVNTFTANASSNVTANISVPTKVSDLTNDSGFITTETDPTVPSWAKQSTKPSYNASEINGAMRVDGSYGNPPYSYGVYGLGSTATQIPVYYSTQNITDSNQVTTKGYVDNAISGITTTAAQIIRWTEST